MKNKLLYLTMVVVFISLGCGGGENDAAEETAENQITETAHETDEEILPEVPSDVILFVGRLALGFTDLRAGFPDCSYCLVWEDSVELFRYTDRTSYFLSAARADSTVASNSIAIRGFIEDHLRDASRSRVQWGIGRPIEIGHLRDAGPVNGYQYSIEILDVDDGSIEQKGRAYGFYHNGFVCALAVQTEHVQEPRLQIVLDNLDSMMMGMYFGYPGQQPRWPDHIPPPE
ncbi:MAG: hypothetical protein GF388_00560 [Candidatus Aegiribacteria sp.]|nr:hypothetical protein [Candidatus Aegiribacteria sp.]MBD3293922.1 hypothetical protein [Candidatus Fermentibacteria bacterium]